jgi:hypothetical protein
MEAVAVVQQHSRVLLAVMEATAASAAVEAAVVASA